MSSNKISGLALMMSRHNLLYASRPALFAQGLVPNHYASFSDCDIPGPEGMGNAMREKSEQTKGKMMDEMRNVSGKVKDRVMGTGANSGHPSKDPEQNHGVEKTDSSCEDVRDRPGGYS